MKRIKESFLVTPKGRAIAIGALLFMSTVNFCLSTPSPAPALWTVVFAFAAAGAFARTWTCKFCASYNRSRCQLLEPSE